MSVEQEPPAAPPTVLRPWPGLAPFTSSDKFCGRDEDIDELLRRLERGIGLVLYGQSGLGKTSLLEAGIVPRLLARHALPISIRLVHSPDAGPVLQQVRAKVYAAVQAADLFETTLPGPDEDLWRYLHRRDVSWLLKDGNVTRPVLIFDQFEEIFTNGQSTPELARQSKELFTELANLVQGRRSAVLKAELARSPDAGRAFKQDRHDYHVLLAIREDYLAHLDTAVERFEAPDLVSNRHRLLPFDGTSALAAVEGPGQEILDHEARDPSVSELIVRKVAAAKQRQLSVAFLGGDDHTRMELHDLRVEPALLSLMCARLNEARLTRQEKSGHAERISAGLVNEVSGQVLDDFYRQALEVLPARVRGPMGSFIEEQLLSESGRYRQQVSLDSAEAYLTERGIPPGEARESFDTLVRQQRLLRIEDRGDVRRIELTHDVLCESVGRSRDARRARQQRVRWWKGVMSGAAALFFVAAVVATAVAVWQRSDAVKQRSVAIEKAQQADDHAADAEKARGEAMAAQVKITRNLESWYRQRIQDAADKKDLAGAAVIRAHGAGKGVLDRNGVLGYIAPPPRLRPLGRVRLASVPGQDAPEAIAHVQWLQTSRASLALTEQRHLWVVPDPAQRPLRLMRNARGLMLAAQETAPGPGETMAEVLCAIPWLDEHGAEGILVGVVHDGAWLVPVAPGQPAKSLLRKDWGEVTALVQSPDTGATWAGLANGLVLPLPKDGGEPHLDAAFLCAAQHMPVFVPEQPWPSPSGRWKYQPIEGDRNQSFVPRRWDLVEVDQGKERERAPRAGAAGGASSSDRRDDASPGEAPKDSGKTLSLPGYLTRDLPAQVLFSPDERFCLVEAKSRRGVDSTWIRVTLPAVKAKAAASKADAGGAAAAPSGSAPAHGELATLDLPYLPHDTELTFLDPDVVLAIRESSLVAQSITNPKVKASLPFQPPIRGADSGEIKVDSVLARGDGTPALVIFRNADFAVVGFHAVQRVSAPSLKLSLVGTVKMHQAQPAPPGLLRDGSGAFWEDTENAAPAPAAGTAPAPPHQKAWWLPFQATAKVAPFPWDRAAQLPPNRVGGLAFDAQGGMLGIAAQSGLGVLGVHPGWRAIDYFFFQPNSFPELLWSGSLENGFYSGGGQGLGWKLDYPPYSLATGPSLNGRALEVGSPTPDTPNGESVAALHPDGQTKAGGPREDEKGNLVLKSSDDNIAGFVIERGLAAGPPPTDLSFSTDGRVLVTGAASGELAWWSLAPDPVFRAPLFTVPGAMHLPPQAAVTEQGEVVLAEASGLRRWQPAHGEPEPLPLPTGTKRVLAVAGAAAPGGAVIALVETTDGRLAICEVESRKEIAAAPLSASHHFQNPPDLSVLEKWHTITGAALAPGGDACVLFGPDGLVEIWRRDAGRLRPVSLPGDLQATGAAFAPQGRVLLFGEDYDHSHLVEAASGDASPPITSVAAKIRAATFVPALQRFLVSFDKVGLTLVDPAHFQAVVPGENAEIADVPEIILPSPDGQFAVVRSAAGVHLYELPRLRPIGPLAAASADEFASGGVVVGAGHPCIVGLSPSAARAWRPAVSWTPEEAARQVALESDDDLNVTRLHAGASAGAVAPAVPPVDPALAADWRRVHQYPLVVQGVWGLATAESPPTTPPLGDAFPDEALRANFEQWRLLVAHRAASPQSAAWLMDSIDAGLMLNGAAGETIPEGDTFPAALRANFLRTVTLAQWNRSLAQPEGDKVESLLTPDKTHFLPALQEAGAKFIATLEQALENGGSRPLSAPDLEAALTTIRDTAQAVAGDEPETVAARVAVRHWLSLSVAPEDITNWNNYAADLSNLPSEDPATPKDGDGLTPRTIQRIRAFQHAVSLFETSTASDREESVSYPLGNWSKIISSAAEGSSQPRKNEWHRVALALAREAVSRKNPALVAWENLRDVSWNDDEKVRAARRVVATDREAGGASGDLVDALGDLGDKLLDRGSLDALVPFEEAMAIDAREGKPAGPYLLEELGLFLQRFGGTSEEWKPLFEEAFKAEAERIANARQDLKKATDPAKRQAAQEALQNALDGRSYWRREEYGFGLELLGDQAGASKAFDEAWQLAQEKKDPSGGWLQTTRAETALDAHDPDTAARIVAEMEQSKLWSSETARWANLANVALYWTTLFPQDPKPLDLARRILEQTDPTSADSAKARAYALVVLNRGDEAWQALDARDQFIRQTAPDELDDSYRRDGHTLRASLTAKRNPHEALWHLAEAVSLGWQEEHDLRGDPTFMTCLKDLPAFQQLLTALHLHYGDPARYLALVHFLQMAVADRRQSGGTVTPEEESALLARSLLDAIEFGWRDPDHLLAPGGALAGVATAKDWAGKLDAAQGVALELLHSDLEALADAWKLQVKALGKPQTSSALLQKLLPHVLGHPLLKRHHGQDLFGHPFVLNAGTHTVSIAPATRVLVTDWQDEPDDFWQIKFDAAPPSANADVPSVADFRSH